MDKPVYRRTATRRESFRIDIEADELRKAVAYSLIEDIPEGAAFRVHDDGSATICWDNDFEVDPDSLAVIAGPPIEPDRQVCGLRTEDDQFDDPGCPLQKGHEGDCEFEIGHQPAELLDVSRGPIAEHVIDEWVEAVDGPPAPQAPTAQTVAVEAASLGADGPIDTDEFGTKEPWSNRGPSKPHEYTGLERQRLVNIAGGSDHHPTEPVTPYEKNLERHGREVGGGVAQCNGSFQVGVTRTFRCHLDLGHKGNCGPAEGYEPEDPPKGRRRSW